MITHVPRILSATLLVSGFFACTARASIIGWWHMDDAGATPGGLITTTASEVNSSTLDGAGVNGAAYSTNVPGAVIYDPITGTSYANTFSLDASNNNAQVRIPNDPLLNADNSFTVEMFIQIAGEPTSYNNFVSRVYSGPNSDGPADSDRRGWQIDFDHGTGSSFGDIRSRWDTPGTPPLDWNKTVRGDTVYVDNDLGSGLTSDYTNSVDRALEGDDLNDPSSLLWHHVALTFDAPSQVFTIWTDYSKGTSRTLSGTFEHPDAQLIFGKFANDGYGLYIDELRYSSGVLDSSQFLFVIPEPTTAIVLLGLISGAFFRRKRRMLA